MRKTLKALFSIVDPTSRATGASHLPRTEEVQNITANAALTDLLRTTANKAVKVAKLINESQPSSNTTRRWTHETEAQGQSLFDKLLQG